MIEVVSAVIVRAGRILLTQRRADKDFAFTWEAPGGKVEPGESAEDAIRREVLEEIASHISSVKGPFWSGEFKNVVQRDERKHVRVSFYEVGIVQHKPMPREGQGIGWFTAEEMLTLKLAPANAKAAKRVVDVIRGAR